MDNLDRGMSNDKIITGPRPLLVCPICGPQNMLYAGRVIAKTCKRCEELMKD